MLKADVTLLEFDAGPNKFGKLSNLWRNICHEKWENQTNQIMAGIAEHVQHVNWKLYYKNAIPTNVTYLDLPVW